MNLNIIAGLVVATIIIVIVTIFYVWPKRTKVTLPPSTTRMVITNRVTNEIITVPPRTTPTVVYLPGKQSDWTISTPNK